jgi:hypothetical protein
MKNRSDSARKWRLLFFVLAILRFAGCVQFIVDDDEAWWVVAARALGNPFDYYLRAVDHKPPGIVWFYWLTGATWLDPRWSRAIFTLLLVGAAFLLGKTAQFFRRSETQQAEPEPALLWITGSFFLVASAMGSPKLFTVTADGLLIAFVIAAYALAFICRFRGRTVAAGALLGCALLVKQTAVFFALPILLATWPKRWSLKEIAGFAAGALAVYLPGWLLCHPAEFWYWNFTYPREVLTRARGAAFDSNGEMLGSVLEFSLAVGPLLALAVFSKCRLRDFRVLWLVSALAGTFLGRGLFLHYFLLAVPPLCLLATQGWLLLLANRPYRVLHRLGGLGLAWLLAGYGLAAAVVAVPFSGLFWGNDLAYYRAVGKKIQILAPAGEPVLVWGGTVLPLTFSGAPYAGRFLIPRFAEPPYDTALTQSLFHRELSQDFPRVVVDLHERGDNKFNNPLSSDPFVFGKLASYQAYVSPGLPWVKFYLNFIPPERAHLVPFARPLHPESYPAEREEWNRLREAGVFKVLQVERELRVHDALVLLAQQGADSKVRAEASQLRGQPGVVANPDQFFARFSGGDPDELVFPWRSPLWWAQSAIVELQPKFYGH